MHRFLDTEVFTGLLAVLAFLAPATIPCLLGWWLARRRKAARDPA